MMMGLLAIAVLALFVTLTLQMSVGDKLEYKEAICQSETCNRTAERVMDSLNRSVDPCEDFYSFACGGWIAKHPISESQNFWDQFELRREEMLKNLKVLLEEPNQQKEPKSMRRARSFYRICMSIASLEKRGLNPIYEVMDRLKLPREPPLDNATISALDLSELAGKAWRLLGLNLLYDLEIVKDTENGTRNRVKIMPMTFDISEQYFLYQDFYQSELQEYKKYVESMVAFSGAGNRSAKFAEEILSFNMQLAEFKYELESNSDNGTSMVTVNDLQNMTDRLAVQWNWTVYLNNVFNNTKVTIPPGEDILQIYDFEYLKKLPQLLSNTSQHILVRFMWWKVYSTLAPMTLQQFRNLDLEFNQQEKTPRWRYCINNANKKFPKTLGYVYIHRHLDEQTRNKTLEMLINVKKALEIMISKLEWMDAGTREQVLRKLQDTKQVIGFFKENIQPDKLDEFYEWTEIVEGKLFETIFNLADTRRRKYLNSLWEEPKEYEYSVELTLITAYSTPYENSFTIMPGILHPPFFGNGLESINYGAMGPIIGHELTHCFDDNDKNGRQRQWWNNETLKIYNEKVECFIKQYSSYHVPELGNNVTVNGTSTRVENIADNVGLRAAYQAYQQLKSRSPNQPALPGLNYTQEQLFFLGFAQVWCANYKNEVLKETLMSDGHTLKHWRVIGTLSNNKEFAKAWQCPKGSPMNPVHKCVLW